MFDQREDERGYFVYTNRFNNTTQLDNPNLTYILNKINEKFATAKYSTYRCASKLFALQKALFTSYIPFQTVSTILERHRLDQIDSAPSIKPSQLTAVLHDVYFAAEQLGYYTELTPQPDREALIAALAGLLWSVFDPKHCQPLSVLELKHTLLLLCETNFEQNVFEHFKLTSDHNLCVSRHRLEVVLLNFSKLLAFLSEPDHLTGALVQEIVTECFVHYPGLVGLTEYQFSYLFKLSSKFSNYSNVIALTKRLRESEFVMHKGQTCGACRTPIQGLRFKCQRCRNLSLCLDCFSHGYSSKSHNVGHKMYEISTNDIATNSFSSLLSKLYKMLSCSTNPQSCDHQPSTYDTMQAKLIDTNAVELQEVELPPAASSTLRGTLSRSLNSTSCASLRKASTKNASIFSNIDCQLFTSSSHSQALGEKLISILEVLEEDGEKYRVKLANLKAASGCIDKAQLDYFDEHGKLVAEQLKVLKEVGAKLGRGFPQSSSTPYRSASVKSAKLSLSTVQSRLEKSIDGAELNKSYVNDQLPTELSVRDVSAWFHLDRLSETMLEQIETNKCKTKLNPKTQHVDELNRCIDNLRMDTQMANFKDLLLKVREIVDDSYSDNTELARTTQQLEKALDRIIEEEERKRLSQI